MKIIGLTGGIGSGKSTVLNLFKNLGFVVYIADIEAKKLMISNEILISEIKSLFGNEAYINNKLNRSYISTIVFNDKNKLAALNELVHPKVREHFKNFVKKSNEQVVIYEAAILFESGNYKFCDYIISVTANFEDRLKRIIKRDKVSKEQVLERIKNQISDEERIKKSHFVIQNNLLKNTKEQVFTIYSLILKLNDKL